ncbi:MAG: ASKHA domain-containing protein [Desulfobacteraceae bacterium]
MSPGDRWIRAVPPDLERPSLGDNTADADRLTKSLARALGGRVAVGFSLLKQVPYVLRENDYRVCSVAAEEEGLWRLVDLRPRNEAGLLGLAVDLGTSTVVARLMDLEGREVQGESVFLNPQAEYGEDVLSRIHFASQDGGLETLRRCLLDELNGEIKKLAEAAGVPPGRLAGAAMAGNTTMTHLFLGLNPFWLCREPYIPAVNRLGILRAGEVGLDINEHAPVLVFPNVGSYFGGDLIAGILASGMDLKEEVSILVDVGTNAEVVLGNKDWLMACAGAAGPALEGGVAQMGMMAGPGVIDRVRVDRDTKALDIHTIGGAPPVGICGSGLIDLVGGLFLAGMLDIRGKFVPGACEDRLKDEDGIPCFVVVPADESGTGRELTLCQPDLDSLIRSKAAMYTILTTVSNMVNMKPTGFSRFYVAGTFGSYIDPRSAIVLGMLPDLPLDRYESLGNTSLEGAAAALMDKDVRDRIDRIRERITYIELNVNQEFMNLFSAAKFIPHTDLSLFPSVKELQGEYPG